MVHSDATASASTVPTRVLVVDDNEDNADSLAILLTARGYDVTLAYDGEAALACASATHPDVILLDIGLSRMNGLEVCARIRGETWGAGATIIAVSGWGQASDLQRSRDAGFDAHLVKPVAFDDLVQAISRLRMVRDHNIDPPMSHGE